MNPALPNKVHKGIMGVDFLIYISWEIRCKTMLGLRKGRAG
jgi:hypothetical protein